MTADPIDGRELLAIRARTSRAAQGQHQSLRQTEADREKLVHEVYRLRARDAAAGRVEALCRDLEAESEAMGVEVPYWVRPVRDALSAPHSPAAARSGTSATAEASGGAGEAQEG